MSVKTKSKTRFWEGFQSVSIYPNTSAGVRLFLRRSQRGSVMQAVGRDFAKAGDDLREAIGELDAHDGHPSKKPELAQQS